MNQIKEDLAYAYKILAYLKLDDLTYTHLSSRSENGFYIYPFGLLFNQVTPDNLLEVTLDGKVLHGAESQYNRTGYVIHGTIYQARPDINTIFHLHTPEIVAVASIAQGLMPISQWALHFYNLVSYHDYDSLALELNQGDKIVHDLAKNYVMLMRNHGSLTCGRTIQEAMFYTHHLQLACRAQIQALSMNQQIIIPNQKICENTVKDLLSFEKNLGFRDWQAWLSLKLQILNEKK